MTNSARHPSSSAVTFGLYDVKKNKNKDNIEKNREKRVRGNIRIIKDRGRRGRRRTRRRDRKKKEGKEKECK